MGATIDGDVLRITADTVSYAYNTGYTGPTAGPAQVRFYFTYEKENPTGVATTKASMPVSTRYYNTLGVASDEPFPGINIVVTRYADGTTRTTKQLRK